MVVNLQGLRDLLADGVPAGKGDEDNVRRQWWAALATVQEDLLLAAGPEPGVWLAAPLPALYEPSLLRRLWGWVWAPREIDRLFQPGAPQLPVTSGFTGRTGATAEPLDPSGGYQRMVLGSEDGTDPLLVVITPGLQVGLAMEGPAGGRRLLVRFEADVLRRALELLDRRLQKEDPVAAQTTPPPAQGTRPAPQRPRHGHAVLAPAGPTPRGHGPQRHPATPGGSRWLATGHRIPSAPSWPCWRPSPMRCAPHWPPSGP